MAGDPVRRRAARAATLVALPMAIGVAVVSLWLFGAFSGPPAGAPPSPGHTRPTSAVTLAVPVLPAERALVCRGVVAQLPETVLDRPRRGVTGPEQNAAYGEPPVTLACGAPPASLAPTADVTTLSGVCWFTETTASATVWTTVDRRTPVRVTVPGSAAGSAQAVIAFSTAIVANDPVAAAIPTGCHD